MKISKMVFNSDEWMKKQSAPFRFLAGSVFSLIIIFAGFWWVGSQIPNWGSAAQEAMISLTGDELIATPDLIWKHAMTIRASPAEIYPWLVQIGDSRAAFYSITFIENLFCMTSGECHYTNADRIHEEWQNPPRGEQGIIINYLVIEDYQPAEFVLAKNTAALPLQWTWLWYIHPLDENSSRLIVRHRIDAPDDVPMGIFNVIMNSGYVMEKAMMLGIRERAEGRIPQPFEEFLGALIWLLVLLSGIIAAIHFVKGSASWHALGVGLEVIVVLFILTFIQPPLWLRLVFLMLIAAGVAILYWKKAVRQSSSLSSDLQESYNQPFNQPVRRS